MNKEQILVALVKANSAIITEIMKDKSCDMNDAIKIWMKINYNRISNYLIIHAE
jgi:hypothetical protein